MLNPRGIIRLLAIFFMVFLLTGVGAEELNKSFNHSLGIGNSAQSYEHRIDLPPNWAASGQYFVARSLKLDGKLVIEKEELTKTYYYVKVRLPKATLWFAKGSIDITLKAEKEVTPPPAPQSPSNLRVIGGYYPRFSWAGSGDYSAISLFDRNSGKTLWERIILGEQHQAVLDEGSLRIGGKYTWAVKMADECGHYSQETQCQFRVDSRQERCRQCFGHGYVTCRYCHGSGHVVVNGPNNTPVNQICHQCNGTGRQRCLDCNGHGYTIVPAIVQETFRPGEQENPETRTILNGKISKIDLSQSTNKLQGKLTVVNDKIEQTFLVSKYTLILIEIDGYLRVTELKHLKPGWKCELAYDVPEDDTYDNMDLTRRLEDENGMKYADNMIVHYEP